MSTKFTRACWNKNSCFPSSRLDVQLISNVLTHFSILCTMTGFYSLNRRPSISFQYNFRFFVSSSSWKGAITSACEKAYNTWFTSPNWELTPVILMGVGKWIIASVIFLSVQHRCWWQDAKQIIHPFRWNWTYHVKLNTLISKVADECDCVPDSYKISYCRLLSRHLVFRAMSTVISSNWLVYSSPDPWNPRADNIYTGHTRKAVLSIPCIQNCFPGLSRYNRDLIKRGRGIVCFPHGGGIPFLRFWETRPASISTRYLGYDRYRFYYA